MEKNRDRFLKFDQFVKERLNERMEVKIEKDDLILTPEEECFNSCWSIIEQQCGGDVNALKKYISIEYDIEEPTSKDIINYIMEIVDDYFNKGIKIIKGEHYVKHGKMDDFIKALTEIDYNMCVEDLIRKLLKVKDKDTPPAYAMEIFQVMAEYLPPKKKK